ncbi:hypothetical protein DLAC_07388 [Tieghemostelium lacteum]|uniref:MD-2-related lipid-recognition domain-containing protein n=1 Tax=Tieghemostelium lacteum TaxID=361077 RepID=A0A151ZCE9_TIELA|nr:hypothetical protein DLAC_07388 [Tieghemostelium lacteum]|eukprot:KYQ91618.1 hypothetical protein DLAC_07388 [Tieghemostelium lacteum]
MNKYFYILVLLVFNISICKSAYTTKLCNDTPSKYLEISNVTVEPYPLVPGHNVTLQIQGKLIKPIEHGSVRITGKYLFIRVINEQLDICSKDLECPIPIGPFVFSYSSSLPPWLPSGKFYGEISAKDGSSESITCVNFSVDL